MSRDGQGAENFHQLSIGRMNFTDDRQTTYGRATANSEREREFTFAKNALAAKISLFHFTRGFVLK